MPKPAAKMNLVRQQILAGLITSKTGERTHKVWDHDLNNGRGDVVESKVALPAAPANNLARNMSERSINRLAERWAA